MINEKTNYTCYCLDNIPGNDFKFLEACSQLSIAKNNVELMQTLNGRLIDLTKIVHAFIAKGLKGPNCIHVFEANAHGIMNNEINIGDSNWDLIFFF